MRVLSPANPITALPPREKRKLSTALLIAFTLVISFVTLFYSLSGIDLRKLEQEAAHLHWRWVAVAVVADILVYFWHGWRWKLLLIPITPVRFWQCLRAIYVGLYANEIFPLRTGEVIRCYLMTKATDVPMSVTLSSALIERIFDGIWLIVCIIVALQYIDLPPSLDWCVTLLVTLIAAAVVLLAFAMFQKDRTHERFVNNRFLRKFRVLLDDLHIIGHSRSLYASMLVSLPYLLMQIVPIYAMMRSYGLEMNIGQAAVVMIVARLGSVVPQAPGNLGGFNAMIIAGLHLFDVPKAIAQRFAVLLWSVITIPLLLGGFIALAITGMKIRELQREARSGMAARKAGV